MILFDLVFTRSMTWGVTRFLGASVPAYFPSFIEFFRSYKFRLYKLLAAS